MSQDIQRALKALKYETEIQENGRLELSVPFAPGTHAVVFVIEEPAEPSRGDSAEGARVVPQPKDTPSGCDWGEMEIRR
jgi:hypothetical protein